MSMDSGLEKVGVAAVVENFDNFKRSINVVRQEILKTGDAARRAGKSFETGAEGQSNYEDKAKGASIVVEKFIGILSAYVKAGQYTTTQTQRLAAATVEYTDAQQRQNQLLLESGKAQEKQSRSIVGTAVKVISLGRAYQFVSKGMQENGIIQQSLARTIVGPVTTALGGLTTAVSGLGKGFALMGAAALKTATIIGGVLVAALAVKMVAGLVKAHAASEGLINAFNNITQAAGVASNVLLRDLRKAAADTIPDLELMRQTNIALAGASGLVAKEVGENLPKLLEVARVQARATGQSVDFLFSSLVTGIKRSSPLLIDNTGLVLKVGEANERYAEQIGEAVTQLTAEEQQLALLNATLAAGDKAIAAAGNSQETLAEKIARTRTIISNTFTEIGVAIQPVFKVIQDVLNDILYEFYELARALAPFIRLFSIIFEKIARAIWWPIKQVLNLFDWDEWSRQFFLGGASLLAALTNGILWAANNILFPAAFLIAEFIASLFVGESPPPFGPLSKIDKGGANTMIAWLEGFTGVSLAPVEQVAKDVQTALFLGGVGTLAREGIEGRLAELDAALQPFIDKLDIIKSQFEDLRGPAEAALRAIDRQLNKAVQALIDGEEGSAAMVRQLDRQREAINGALDAQQQQIDQAQIQLALAKQQQSTERVLLNIRLRQLGPVEEQAAMLEKAKKASEKMAGKGREKKPKVGTGDVATPEVAQTAIEGLTGVDAGPGGIGILSEAKQKFLDLTQGQRDLFQTNLDRLKPGFDRVKESFNVFGDIFSNIPNMLKEALSGIGGIFDEYVVFPIETFVNEIRGLIFGNEDSLRNLLVGFFQGAGIDSLEAIFVTLPSFLYDNLTSVWSTAKENVWGLIWTNENSLGKSILNFFTGEGEGTLYGFLVDLPTNLLSWLVYPVENTANELIQWLFNPDTEGGLAARFSLFFKEQGINSLSDLLEKGIDKFKEVPGAIGDALKNVGVFVWNNFAVPFIRVINWVIARIADFLGTIEDAFSIVDALGINTPTLPRISPIDIFPPDFLVAAGMTAEQLYLDTAVNTPSNTGGATGGLFGPGVLQVGERGREYVASAQKMMVFPNEFVRAMDIMTNLMSSMVTTMPAMAGATNITNIDNSMTGNFNMNRSTRDTFREFSMMRAFKG